MDEELDMISKEKVVKKKSHKNKILTKLSYLKRNLKNKREDLKTEKLIKQRLKVLS